ncbi:MAG: NAD(P)H-hydrate dehydratase [Rhodospirillaceae bacterium]|nr:NAD(P)H-hydrate dehydratase [Rhodospirillaceae bacterium]
MSGGRQGAAFGPAPVPWGGGLEILTTGEMGQADRRTIAAGTPGIHLMERAGLAIAEAVAARWSVRPVTVLCGPGNNGGDGYVAARRLAQWGWPVTLAQLGDPGRLTGDAAIAAARWAGPVAADGVAALQGADLAIDALFGAGLARPLDGAAADWVRALAAAGCPVVAVDMPSGVDGDSGAVKGVACPAVLTVTFARRKIGHVIGEGLLLSGELVVADIGIPDAVVTEVAGTIRLNDSALWQAELPRRRRSDHKYRRGHLLLHAGAMAGAAVLAATAARRVGAGLVTVVTDAERTATAVVSSAPGTIVAAGARWPELLADPRLSPVLIGPGAGRSNATRSAVQDAAGSGKALVFDADALTAFADDPDVLFGLLGPEDVLTPHAGEFDRLFGRQDAVPAAADKITRTRAAAALCGAVVLHKGPDTVIAAPDGRVVVETSGPPSLATAGSGDVLAGIVAGLISQGMTPLSGAAAAARRHAVVAANCVKNLIAEDLVTALGDDDSQMSH